MAGSLQADAASSSRRLSSICCLSSSLMQNMAKCGPEAVDDAQLAGRDHGLLFGAVVHGEEHAVGERHDEGPGPDPAERRLEIAARVQAASPGHLFKT
jgi:hypothetical protein